MGKKPSARTVVFRGFYKNTASLLMATDCRSNKVNDIKMNHQGAVCCYFSGTREQYRISGDICVIGIECRDQEYAGTRRELWSILSDSIKEQFFWPQPGSACGTANGSKTGRAPFSATPPAVFCLLVLKPSYVDYLNLGFRPHRRIIHELQTDGTWSEGAVNP
jgi:PPOX class probable FMN-dependent enzyme